METLGSQLHKTANIVGRNRTHNQRTSVNDTNTTHLHSNCLECLNHESFNHVHVYYNTIYPIFWFIFEPN